MAEIIVMGGGLCGMASALLLARDGHAVTVLERVLALPSEVFGRPGFLDRVLEVAEGRQMMSPPGPTRQELLDLIA